VYGLLDDNKALHGTEFGDVSVLGETEDEWFSEAHWPKNVRLVLPLPIIGYGSS